MGRVHLSLLQTSAATYLGMAIQFVSVVIVSRLLAPEEIGIFSVTAAVVAVGHVFRDFGIGQYLVQEKNLDRPKIRSAFGLAIFISSLVAAALWLLSGPAATFYGSPGVGDVMILLAFNFLILPLGAPAMSLLRRDFHFGRVAVVELTTTFAQAALTVLLALLGFSYMSMAWSSVAATFLTVLMLWVVKAPHLFTLPDFSIRRARRIIGFGAYACGSSLVHQLSSAAPDVVMGKLIGFEAVALFSRGQGLTNVFSRCVRQVVASVAHPSFAAYHRAGRPLKPEYLRSVTLMTALALPFYGLLALFAGPLIIFLFGAPWAPAIPVLQVLCIGQMVFAFFSLSEGLFFALGFANLMFRKNMAFATLRILLTVLAAFHSLIAVAVAQVAAEVLHFLIVHRYLGRVIHVSAADTMAAAGRSLLVTLATLAPAIVGLSLMDAPSFAAVVALGAASATAWVAALILTRHPLRRELAAVIPHLPGVRAVRARLRVLPGPGLAGGADRDAEL